MCNRDAASKQIGRLSVLPFWAQLTDVAAAELTKALSECCTSPRHAELAIDLWLRDQSSLPTPADLRAVCRDTLEPDKPHSVGGRCVRCSNGWEPCILLRTRPEQGVFGSGGTVTIGADECAAYQHQQDRELAVMMHFSQLQKGVGENQEVGSARRRCACQGAA